VDRKFLEGEFWSHETIQKEDSLNFIKLTKLVGKNNFPKESEIGKRQQKAVFMPIIHNAKVSAMQTYLPLIEDRCKNGEAAWIYYALLYDKIKMIQGLPQRYGTQFQDHSFKKLYLNEGIEKVNAARIKLGLEPIASYLF
jgi:hypothetical protein